tara:strand:- start:46556 stop:47632 length:1077 start_codon:yes stop_codon:yes gene_type:complete
MYGLYTIILMPPRTKVKKIVKENNVNDKDYVESVVGNFMSIFDKDNTIKADISFNKLKSLKHLLWAYKKILEVFYKHEIMIDILSNNNEYFKFKTFIDSLEKYNKEFIIPFDNIDQVKKKSPKITEIIFDENIYDEEKEKTLSDIYKSVKESEYVESAIETLTNLSAYKSKILEENNTWINNISGFSFEFLSFSSINFKYIIQYEIDDKNDDERRNKFIYSFINKLYKCCDNIYTVITKSDFDISKFTDIIINNLDMLKKELPGCNEGFNVIEDALNKMNKNFDDYYRIYEVSKDPTALVENFIKNLYDDNKDNKFIISQLRKIITHFSGKIKSNNAVPSNVVTMINKLNKMSDDIGK